MKSSISESASRDEDSQPIFSKWREFNINDEVDDEKETTSDYEEEDTAGRFQMFEPDDDDVYEDVPYQYSVEGSTVDITIRHHGAYPNSTGLAVWRGAEILARFLVDAQQQKRHNPIGIACLRNKKVLEVGAGAGLPSIVAHKVLGASRVLVTDGDFDALNNLKHNVDLNRIASNTISCRQLIWGKDIPEFLKEHGKQDVVLMADCVYMVPSLVPLWETIDSMLATHGIVVYAQTAASAVPWENFKAAIERHDFETICALEGKEGIRKYDVDNDTKDQEDDENCKRSPSDKQPEEYESGIFVFRRRQERNSPI